MSSAMIGKLSPGKIVRTMPDHFIRPTAHDLAFRKYVTGSDPSSRLLNIGCGEVRPLVQPNVLNADIAPGRYVHVVADAHALPFREGAFDGVVCRAVIEHLHDPTTAAREMHRVLVEDGVMLVSAPFVYPYHAHPHDYQRFTAAGLRALFAEFEEVECGIGRLPTAALLSVLEAYVSIFSDNRVVAGLLRWAVAWALNPLKYLDHYLKRRKKVGLLASYFFVGRKRRRTPTTRLDQDARDTRLPATVA
jgi:SAM-dependent methyltransferase